MRRILTLFTLAVAALTTACLDATDSSKPSDPSKETFSSNLGIDLSTMTRTSSGLYYKDLAVGSGDTLAGPSDSVKVKYGLRLRDGSLVDTSALYDTSGVSFRLTGTVQGFREGVTGMKRDGVRLLVIPSALGYDPAGAYGNQLYHKTLVFNVKLVSVLAKGS